MMSSTLFLVLLLGVWGCVNVNAQDTNNRFCPDLNLPPGASPAEEGRAVVLEIMNGRGRWCEIQDLFPQQIYTDQNLIGAVEAAAASARVRGFIQPKVGLLEDMRSCVQEEYETSKKRNLARREDRNCETRDMITRQSDDDNITFTYDGYYDGQDAWNREKDDDFSQSECLLALWEQNAMDDQTIVLQHYGGSSGFIRGMFSPDSPQYVDFPEDDRADARTMPTFVSTTTLQKDVIILVDATNFDDDWFDQAKEGVRAVIEGLYDRDYFQIVVQSGERTLLNECGVDGLLRGTESNKKIALEWFEGLELREVFSSNTDLGNMTALVEEGFDLIKAAINSPNNADSGCEPVFLLLSTQQPDGDTVNYMNSENEEYGVRLFTFGLASATDPEGYLGGGPMYDLACSNDGTYYNVEEPNGLPNDMIQYLIVLIYTRTSLAPAWFARHASYGPINGLVVVGSLPVFSEDGNLLLGVVSIEFSFAEIENFLGSLARGFSFAFLTTTEGDLLAHPSYRSPEVVKSLPLYYDVSLIENSVNFTSRIRVPLVTDLSGAIEVLVDRPLPKGDIGTEGVTTIPLLTQFFWSRLTDMPFTVTLAFSVADLRAPFYSSNQEAGWISSGRVEPIFGDSESRTTYFPDDFFGSTLCNTTSVPRCNQTLSYKYGAIIDNFRSFLPELQELALNSVNDSSTAAFKEYLSTSELLNPDTIKPMMTFINDFVTTYNQNPGLSIQVKELSRIGSLFTNFWLEDFQTFCNGTDLTGPDCSDPAIARFMGFYTQSLITFPGFIQHPLGQTPLFQARFRPWYQRAEANPDVVTVAAPYEDAFFGGTVMTVSQAVFGDPDLSPEEREIVGVVAVDYSYNNFHEDFTSQTGCAYDFAAVSSTVPLCYVMDNSALVVLAPQFINNDLNDEDNVVTASENVQIGEFVPELGDQLLEDNVLVLDFFTNFRGSNPFNDPIDTPQELPLYSINTELLEEAGGSISGTLRKENNYCISGEWTISIMEGTNLFLVVIENYDADTGDDCRQFTVETVQNISFSTCEENSKLYTFSRDICPNSDQREFVIEMLRPEESKCDRTPPKETEFIAWSDPVAIAMVTVASFLLVLTLVIWGLVFKYRATPVILMASPTFIHMQFFGFILGYCNIYLWTGEPTDVQCALRPWLASISFVLIVGPMFAKTYRVWKLFSPKFFDRGISDVQVLLIVGLMMVFPIIVCIVWLSYERPQPTIKDDNFDDEKTVFRCDSEGISCRVFEGIMIGYAGCLVALGSYFAFRSRRARSYFNEARFIGFSIYAIASCGIVGVTLTYVLLGLPVGYYCVFCVSVMVGVFATMMIVYFPKLKICIFKPDRNVIDKSAGEKDNSVVSEPNLEDDDSD